MSYLDKRIENFNRFQQILSASNQQCGGVGNFFKLNINGAQIIPELKYLSGGAYGTTFDIIHPELAARRIKATMKSMDNNEPGNINEIAIGYALSQLALNGETPHFPLYAKCFNYSGNQNSINNCVCSINGGCFKTAIVNAFGVVQPNHQITNLPNPPTQNIQNFINRQNNDQCLLSFSERLDGDLEGMLNKKILEQTSDLHMFKFLLISLFQSIMGLKAMYDAGYTHTDFHTGNVLYKNNMYEACTPYIQYIYNVTPYNDQGQNINFGQTKITITHGNILAILWDFGLATQRQAAPVAYPYGNQHAWVQGTFGADAIALFNPGQSYSEKWKIGALFDIARLVVAIKTDLQAHQVQYPRSFSFFNNLTTNLISCLNKQAEFYDAANNGTYAASRFFPHDIDPLVILKYIMVSYEHIPDLRNIITSIVRFDNTPQVLNNMNAPYDINSVAKIYPTHVKNAYFQMGQQLGIPNDILFGFKSKRKSSKTLKKSKRKSSKTSKKSKRKSKRVNRTRK